MTRNPLLLLTLAAFTLPACAQSSPEPAHPGIDLSAIDKTVAPGDNFFRYADGAWIARTQIPADRAGLSVFAALADRSSKQVASIIEDSTRAHSAPNSDARKIADLYASFMDEGAIESRGLTPLKQQLAEINAIHTETDLARVLGETLRADVDALNNTNFHTPNLFGLWVAPGFNDPDHYAPYLLQGGLELPNRDFYLGDSDRMKSMRAAYQKHVTAMLTLAGFDQADGRAAAIVALEHSIAERHVSLADSEDIARANNTWTMADFDTKAPGLDWPTFFQAAGLLSDNAGLLSGNKDKQQSFIVWQPSAFTAESVLVQSVPIEIWRDYLAYHLIESYAAVLPKSFAEERFNFFGTNLSGTTQQRPRDQRAIAVVNGTLGDAVGQIYAQRYFPPEAKAQAQALVANLMAAFRTRLEALTWMAPATKKEALAKLDTLSIGIGYPEHWRSYAGLDIRANDALGNLWRASLFDYHFALARIGKPVDRREWCMEPQTVNAVNLPLDNGLNFPAAILQPPFFDPAAPAVTNYGHIGAIIGHEISHTFDSEGAAFDSHGRVRNWWTAADLAHFNASTAALAAEYDTYAPFPDLHLNGRQTLGENIADLAGITAALDAFHIAAKTTPAVGVGGFTPDQQFFLAFAQNYQSKTREGQLRSQVLTDPHSPGEFRADTVRNLDAWYAAFDVKPGQMLYLAPADRVRIW